MTLNELFEALNTPPGITYTLNSPTNPNGNISTTANISANSSLASNSSINSTEINQKLSKGSTINLPVGPSKQPTLLKITNVSTNDNLIKGKTVTVANPQNPNGPEQTYKFDDLATMITNVNTNRV